MTVKQVMEAADAIVEAIEADYFSPRPRTARALEEYALLKERWQLGIARDRFGA